MYFRHLSSQIDLPHKQINCLLNKVPKYVCLKNFFDVLKHSYEAKLFFFILISSYSKLDQVRFEATSTEFHPTILSDWALSSWVQWGRKLDWTLDHKFDLHSKLTADSYSNVTFCSVFRFSFGHWFYQWPHVRQLTSCIGNHINSERIYP